MGAATVLTMIRRVLIAAAVLLASVTAGMAQQRVSVPRLVQRVTDLTGTLSPADSEVLSSRLAELERHRGSQIAILIVSTTGADGAEQYATRVFDQWRLGRDNVDDGVLLLVAKDDHAVRIETGRGLEGTIPDIVAGRIIREQIAPSFEREDYAGGLERAVNALIQHIDGEALPVPNNQPRPKGWPLAPSESDFPPILWTTLVALFAIMLSRSAGLAVQKLTWALQLDGPRVGLIPLAGAGLSAGGLGLLLSGGIVTTLVSIAVGLLFNLGFLGRGQTPQSFDAGRDPDGSDVGSVGGTSDGSRGSGSDDSVSGGGGTSGGGGASGTW